MSLPTLYSLSQELVEAQKNLLDLDLPDNVVADTLEGLEGELKVKGENVAAMARNLESLANQIELAEKEMSRRRKIYQARAEWLKKYLKDNMEHVGLTEISCPYFVIKIKNNPVAVDVFDTKLVPDEYMTIPPLPEPTPDKRKIKEAIENKIEVPGAALTRGTRIEIK